MTPTYLDPCHRELAVLGKSGRHSAVDDTGVNHQVPISFGGVETRSTRDTQGTGVKMVCIIGRVDGLVLWYLTRRICCR